MTPVRLEPAAHTTVLVKKKHKTQLDAVQKILLDLSTLIHVPTIWTSARESLNSGEGGLGQVMFNLICPATATT